MSQITRVVSGIIPFLGLEGFEDYIGRKLCDDGDFHIRVYLR